MVLDTVMSDQEFEIFGLVRAERTLERSHVGQPHLELVKEMFVCCVPEEVGRVEE